MELTIYPTAWPNFLDGARRVLSAAQTAASQEASVGWRFLITALPAAPQEVVQQLQPLQMPVHDLGVDWAAYEKQGLLRQLHQATQPGVLVMSPNTFGADWVRGLLKLWRDEGRLSGGVLLGDVALSRRAVETLASLAPLASLHWVSPLWPEDALRRHIQPWASALSIDAAQATLVHCPERLLTEMFAPDAVAVSSSLPLRLVRCITDFQKCQAVFNRVLPAMPQQGTVIWAFDRRLDAEEIQQRRQHAFTALGWRLLPYFSAQPDSPAESDTTVAPLQDVAEAQDPDFPPLATSLPHTCATARGTLWLTTTVLAPWLRWHLEHTQKLPVHAVVFWNLPERLTPWLAQYVLRPINVAADALPPPALWVLHSKEARREQTRRLKSRPSPQDALLDSDYKQVLRWAQETGPSVWSALRRAGWRLAAATAAAPASVLPPLQRPGPWRMLIGSLQQGLLRLLY
jgi:hypothetical protein